MKPRAAIAPAVQHREAGIGKRHLVKGLALPGLDHDQRVGG